MHGQQNIKTLNNWLILRTMCKNVIKNDTATPFNQTASALL